MLNLNNIPDNVAEGMLELKQLSESDFNDLIVSIENTQIEIHPTRFANKVHLKIINISSTILKNIFMSVVSIHRLKENNKNVGDNFIAELIDYIKNNKVGTLTLKTKEESEIFGERIAKLLSAEKIILSQNISNIFYNHENLLNDVQIETDIRPIFVNNSKGTPNIAVLSATLHLDYHNNQQYKTIQIGIDRRDIDKLKKAIEDAENKIKVLENVMQQGGMKEIKIEKENN